MITAVDTIVSPLGTPIGSKRGRGEDRDDTGQMIEGSPSPVPDRESGLMRERLKRPRACNNFGEIQNSSGFTFGRENSSNYIRNGEGDLVQNGFTIKRSRMVGEDPESSSSSVNQGEVKDSLFSDSNSNKLRENLYTHMERQLRSSKEQSKKLEREVVALRNLNHRLLGTLREKEEENRVLRKGVAIADGRNREMHQQMEDIQVEHRRDEAHLSQARMENNQLQMVLMQANVYIRQLEGKLQQQSGNGDVNSRGGSYSGDGGNDGGFLDQPPPDVF